MEHPETVPTIHRHMGCGLCGKDLVCLPADEGDDPFLTTSDEVQTHMAKASHHAMRVHGAQLQALGAFDHTLSEEEFLEKLTQLVDMYRVTDAILSTQSMWQPERESFNDYIRRMFG